MSDQKRELTIKTIAFFDLETTGLPDLEFFKTKITELSIVAVSVDHLLETKSGDVPRVLHKLSICLNPYKRIDLKSSEITGLTNEMLEHEKKFDKNTMNLLECFIFQLQQPVCLISHNGDNFDFPLLKKQYEVHEGAFPHSLKCCDSLPVFRKIDDLLAEQIALLSSKYSLEQWKKTKDEHENLLMNVEIEQILESVSTQQTSSDGRDSIFLALVKNELNQIEKTEQDDTKLKSLQAINETTPHKPIKASNLQPAAQNIPGIRKRTISSKRELFPSATTSKTRQWTKGKYTLREICKRFYNAYPDSAHNAEADVMALLKCVVACKHDFIKIVNEAHVDFGDVKKF